MIILISKKKTRVTEIWPFEKTTTYFYFTLLYLLKDEKHELSVVLIRKYKNYAQEM
jgi:hypothetical protein